MSSVLPLEDETIFLQTTLGLNKAVQHRVEGSDAQSSNENSSLGVEGSEQDIQAVKMQRRPQGTLLHSEAVEKEVGTYEEDGADEYFDDEEDDEDRTDATGMGSGFLMGANSKYSANAEDIDSICNRYWQHHVRTGKGDAAQDAEEDDEDDALQDAEEDEEDDLADLESETNDAEAEEVEDAKEAAAEKLTGCDNGGPVCADASSEPEDPFDVGSSDGEAVGDDGSLDMASVLANQEKKAGEIVAELEMQAPQEKAKMKQARTQYKAARGAVEQEFRAKMKELNSKSASGKENVRLQKKAIKQQYRGKARRQAMRAFRKEKRSARKNARRERRAAKKQLRKDRRAGRKAAKAKLKDARAAFKKFKKTLRKARFNAKILPRIRKMLTADVQGNMTEMDMGSDGEAGMGSQIVNDVALKAINDPEALKFYMTEKVREKVMTPLTAKFNGLLDKMWGLLGRLKSTISTALVSTVGSVPFVGGVLSAMIPPTLDKAFEAIKNAVNKALNNVLGSIVAKIIESIVSPLVDAISKFLLTGVPLADLSPASLPTPDELAVGADMATAALADGVQKGWGQGLDEARMEAAAQEGGILSDADEEAASEAEDEKEEQQMEVESLGAASEEPP